MSANRAARRRAAKVRQHHDGFSRTLRDIQWLCRWRSVDEVLAHPQLGMALDALITEDITCRAAGLTTPDRCRCLRCKSLFGGPGRTLALLLTGEDIRQPSTKVFVWGVCLTCLPELDTNAAAAMRDAGLVGLRRIHEPGSA
jgi:hypothetical protein